MGIIRHWVPELALSVLRLTVMEVQPKCTAEVFVLLSRN